MEVRLETVVGQTSPKDTFVSMRIGDVQKQSRLSASKTYRFPDPGEKGPVVGRIEVFKRIGHLTVGFDNSSGQGQDVEVPCNVPGLDKLRLSLAVTGASFQGEEIPVSKKAKVKSKMDAAQTYLTKHGLEEALADAMREVIHQKPSDPHTFLANHIMKHAPSKDMPPPPPARAGSEIAGKPAKAAAPALEELRQQAANALVNAARDGTLERALARTKGSTNDIESIRAQARQALMRSAQDGTLEGALSGARASSKDMDALRSQACDSLLRSARDGTLKAALAAAKPDRAADVEALRMQARQALLRSADDGTLKAALGDAKASATDIEVLRGQARQALLSSARNGKLAAALSEAEGDLGSLRAQARQALLRSAIDGSLEAALGQAKGSSDELRVQARDAMLNSARDGTLGEVVGKAMAGGALLRSARDGSLKALLGGVPIEMPFKDYYATNITPLPTSDLQNLYSKFPSKPKPAVKVPDAGLEALCSNVEDALVRSAQDGTLKASLQSCSDVEALRLQAKDALQRSAKDGSLNAILREEQGSSMDIAALRSQANQALLCSAKDGSLQKVLVEERSSFTDMASLRSQAQGALLHSAKNGTLQATLTSNPDVFGLCCQVKDALLHSARDGSLKDNLNKANGLSQDIEKLRVEARNTLLRSAHNGTLVAALCDATGGSSMDVEAVEALRKQAQTNLLRSVENGTLEAALRESNGSASKDIEALRKEARNTLLCSAQNGTLEAVLCDAKGSSSKDIDALRAEARDSLLRSARNGTLKDALTEAKTINPMPTINPIAVMSFDEIDLNRDGRIDKDEWERAVAAANAKVTSPISHERSRIAELQDTISKKDAEINALQELLRSTGSGPVVGARPAINIPFKDYYVANFLQLQTSDFQSLYSNFPAKPKPKPCETSQTAALNKTPFAMLPSVGTWLAKPSKRPWSANVVGCSQEKLMTMKPEDLVRSFQKEINQRDEEIKRLRQMLNL